MKATIYWINTGYPGKLAIVPRPRGGDWLEDELQALRQGGLDVIVSLLETDEATDLGLELESELSRAAGLEFISFPIVDRSIPVSSSAAVTLLEDLLGLIAAGKNVGVHCRQGIGRSALVAAGVLTLDGVSPSAAFQLVGDARGIPVPETEQQRNWVIALAKEPAKRAA
ncbi:MAG: tyrosine protein phosphatase [Acidobacteriota bacterium]|nr:tyrosine protein phosphatase [Acidobacteriota bacterium]